MYSVSMVITTVCHAVTRFDTRLEMLWIMTGPWPWALVAISTKVLEQKSGRKLTETGTDTKRLQLQILESFGTLSRADQARGLIRPVSLVAHIDKLKECNTYHLGSSGS